VRKRFLSSILVLLALGGCGSDDSGGGSDDGFTGWTLEDLTADQGFSIRIPQRELEPGTEDQNCYFLRVPDLNHGQDFFVSRVHTAQNPGSHHMNVFRVKTVLGLRPEDGEPIQLGPYAATVVRGGEDYAHNPCWKSANWADWPLIANSQASTAEDPYTDWRLPEGVGIRLTPGEMLMVQTHYVNTSVQPTPHGSKVGINFHRFPGSGNPVEMGSLFATQQSIRICRSNPHVTFSGACRFPRGQVTIAAANGHFHSRGKSFSVFSWDGKSDTQPPMSDEFYVSDRWDEPPMKTDIDVKPPVGGGVWWNCEYQWQAPPPEGSCDQVDAKDPQHQGDCCYTFGGNTDVGEHCNLFLYYYPKVDSTDVFCN
jgi:hypothetical protein